MSISSMTGFSRASAGYEGLHWQWDIKSVNGKALDVRSRLPQGFDHLEVAVREAVSRHIRRGNVQVSLTCDGVAMREQIVVNEPALEQVVALAERLGKRLGSPPPRVEGLLGLRGILETRTVEDSEDAARARDRLMLESLERALADLAADRRAEGSRLAGIVSRQLQRIEELTIAARDNPARAPEIVRERLAEQVQRLLSASTALDTVRLHQEAAVLATRADIQEEIDRLLAHVEAARKLLTSPEPAGRSLDFLAQEFNREANTLCSKASDRTLTQTGLDLKAVIDQMREQVQNIE
jgi:uncharacterized protein (TIGR00255 family)